MSSTSVSPIVFGQKPQVKSCSPACRSLFGTSEASLVTKMLSEIIVLEQKKARNLFNFDIKNEEPLVQDQQENVSAEPEKTPERRRYFWKGIPDGEAPEFYSRRYKGKKCLMPVDLSQCSDESRAMAGQNGRSRAARRSLNGFLRSPSKHLSPKSANIIRPSSASKLNASPMRSASPKITIDSPVCFDDSSKSRLSVLRPLPLHASSDNVTTKATSKLISPVKSLSNPYTTGFVRSPVTPQRNDTYCARTLDFSERLPKPTPVFNELDTVKLIPGNPKRCGSAPLTPSRSLLKTPQQTITTTAPTAKSLKQLKITEMVPARKTRTPSTNTRKRLAFSQDDSSIVTSSAKTPRLAPSQK